MMVLFLVGLVSMILLRTLRKDYARYGKDDDLDDMVGTFMTYRFRVQKDFIRNRHEWDEFWSWKYLCSLEV